MGQLSFPEGVGVRAKKFPKFPTRQPPNPSIASSIHPTQNARPVWRGCRNEKWCQGWHVDIQHPHMNTKIPNLSRKKQPNKSIIIGTKTVGGLKPNQKKMAFSKHDHLLLQGRCFQSMGTCFGVPDASFSATTSLEEFSEMSWEKNRTLTVINVCLFGGVGWMSGNKRVQNMPPKKVRCFEHPPIK